MYRLHPPSPEIGETMDRSGHGRTEVDDNSFRDSTERKLTAVTEMSSRIDNLETAISDLMQGGEPPSPSPAQKRH